MTHPSQPPQAEQPDPASRRSVVREVVGVALVLAGGTLVVVMAVLLGGWRAAGMVAGLIVMVAGVLLVSTASPDVSEPQRPEW